MKTDEEFRALVDLNNNLTSHRDELMEQLAASKAREEAYRAEVVAALKEDLETERMKVVACGVVAMANTRETAEEARKMRPEYRSASLGDVERAVDCEMQYREELAEAHKQNAMMREYLERLACLGNGNRHGNSVGNCLAIEALAATEPKP